jgi:hypothetical protein
MKPQVDFRTSSYFTGMVYWLGIVFLVMAMFLIVENVIAGIILIFLGVLILTTHYRLKIDFGNKVYHEYVWILGVKNGERKKFETMEYLFIKRQKVSQTMSIRVASTTIRKDQFNGYLRFSETEKLHIDSMDHKKNLIAKLKKISDKLNVKIIDYSECEPAEI